MASTEPTIVGLIPAAGRALRLGRLPCSKELLPVAPAQEGSPSSLRTGIEVLLERLAAGGVSRAFVIMDRAKGDLPRHLAPPAAGPPSRPALAFVPVADSPSVPHTLDRAYPFLAAEPAPWVALGFADVLFEPADAFRHLVERRRRTDAAVVLGLFPARDPSSTDMVATGHDGRVLRIDVRPRESELTLAWALALWDRRFTELLHRAVGEPPEGDRGELQLGALLARAVAEGMPVQSVAFAGGRFHDLGTPEGYAEAIRDAFSG